MGGPKFVVCFSNEGFLASLKIGKLYQMIPEKGAEKLGDLRVIDEDGEDYFYDSKMFCQLHVPPIVDQTPMSVKQQG